MKNGTMGNELPPNTWTSGFILKDVEYYQCNNCGTLQQYSPFNMNFCGCCGIHKDYIYHFHKNIKKVIE